VASNTSTKLIEETNAGEKSLELTVNGPISFAVDGSNLYLRDEKGKEHKLALISKGIAMRIVILPFYRGVPADVTCYL